MIDNLRKAGPGNSYRLSSMTIFFFSSRRRHTRLQGDWSSDVCSSDLLNRLKKKLIKRHKKNVTQRKFYRTNERIFAHTLRVLDSVGKQIGVLSKFEEIGRASCRERV